MKTKYLLRIIFITGISLFFILPLVQTRYTLLPKLILHGVEQAEVYPAFTFQNFKTGEFQQAYEKWWNQNFGLKEYFVKTNNQIYYTLLSQTPPNSQVWVGKNKQLIEGGYISEYLNFIQPIDSKALEAEVQKMKTLQDILRGQGKTFLVMITPSKAAIYPEYIPDQLKYLQINTIRNYDLLVPLFDKYGINYVDGHKITKEQKSKSKYAMFPKGGTHWNYLAAYYTTEKVIEKIEELTGKRMKEIGLSGVESVKPVGTDRDLADLVNLWIPPTNYSSPHPVLTAKSSGTEYKPTILMEGASFSEQFINTLKSENVYKSIDFYFYYHTLITFKEGNMDGSIKGEVNKKNLKKDIQNHDIIILELNEQSVGNIKNGFLQDIMNALK